MQFSFNLVNHPAQADHPIRRGEKLFDDNGEPVPLFPGSRAVRWDGVIVAYVSDSGNVAFQNPKLKLPEPLKEACVKFVDETFKCGDYVSEVPDVPTDEDED